MPSEKNYVILPIEVVNTTLDRLAIEQYKTVFGIIDALKAGVVVPETVLVEKEIIKE